MLIPFSYESDFPVTKILIDHGADLNFETSWTADKHRNFVSFGKDVSGVYFHSGNAFNLAEFLKQQIQNPVVGVEHLETLQLYLIPKVFETLTGI